jgi:hypothetical protein
VIAGDEPTLLKERLGNTVIELRVPDQDRAVRATVVISERLSRTPERQDAVLRISSRDGAGLLLDVLHLLDEHALTPRNVTVGESSLDDVFVALTGRHAEDGDTQDPPSSPSPAGGAP